MKKILKYSLPVVCALLLVCASVMGTLAYLTSKDEVVNTFTVGKVSITVDESPVNLYGEVTAEGSQRVSGNTYKLIPGHTYVKDPIIHVTADSESAWLFVVIDNQIADIESGTTIAEQITENGWKLYEDYTNVYYKAHEADGNAKDYPVFRQFTVTPHVDGQQLAAYADKTVTVTAYAVQKDGFGDSAPVVVRPHVYHWKPSADGTALESMESGRLTYNAAQMTQGSIVGGQFTNTRFTLSQTVDLLHDREWSIEWRSSGTWKASSDGGLLFSQFNTSGADGNRYVFRRDGSDFIALGTYENGKYHNYGVKITNIDTGMHTFRLENRIADDGSNMVYLLVDGAQIGALNQYYIGLVYQNTTSDWVSGKDFRFCFMGTSPHTVGSCTIEYIRVNEGIALNHSAAVTPAVEPTLTEPGLTEGRHCELCGEILVYQEVIPSLSDTMLKEILSGKKLSVFGDSISTYAGWSNSTAVNDTLGSNAVYYPQNYLQNVDSTWWKQTADQYGMEILVNNSWSGSSVTNCRPQYGGLNGYGWNIRPGNLHDNTLSNNPGGTVINPDIIAIYMGTNDLMENVSCNTGIFDDAFWAKIEADGFVPSATGSFEEACALMVYKVRKNYPNAEIFCFNNPVMRTGNAANRAAYNEAFQAIAEHYGCHVVDLYSSDISNYSAYTGDGIHPTAAGMQIMSQVFIESLKEVFLPENP